MGWLGIDGDGMIPAVRVVPRGQKKENLEIKPLGKACYPQGGSMGRYHMSRFSIRRGFSCPKRGCQWMVDADKKLPLSG